MTFIPFSLQAGTEGGYVCIFDVVDDGVVYDRVLEKQEGRIAMTYPV